MNRRQFLKSASALAATSALAGVSIPHVFAAQDNTIRVALVGCGGRGSGAVANALSTRSGPIKLVAIADLFDSQIKAHYPHIKKSFNEAADVPQDRMGAPSTRRASRVHGPVAESSGPANPGKLPDVLYQVQKFHAFLWASGGLFSDFYIHNRDECCWMKDAWRVKAEAMGGRHYRG